MPDLTHGPLRYLRGTVLGLIVGLTSLLGHVAGHGDVALVPSLLVLGLALSVAAALTNRRVRPSTLAVFLVAFQFLTHWLLSLEHSAANHVHATGTRVWAAHRRTHLDLSATTWVPNVDLTMITGHAIATLLIVSLVWRADAAVFAFAAALRRAMDVVLGGGFGVRTSLVTPYREGCPPLFAPTAAVRALSHPSPRQHRGPPAAL